MSGGLALACRRAHAQQPPDAQQLASYRLTEPVFNRFTQATRLIAKVLSANPRYAADPLFSREISVSGDAPEMARVLEERLDADPALSAALFAAEISARDYATFAIALLGARLAHGFVKSGAMRRVPAGVAADNVAFVEAHHAEISALLKLLDLE